MKYRYRAVDSQGKIVTGNLSGQGERAALRQLQKQGLTALEINNLERIFAGKTARPPKKTEILVVLHQLTTLLESGVSLGEAVDSLAQSVSQPFLARALGDISAKLRRGVDFSTALQESKLNLPVYLYYLAEAGELTGKLASALRDGVAQMEYEMKIANEMRNALIYPAILVVSGIAAVLLIFMLVVPRFSNLLKKSGGDIPFISQIILGIGQFVNQHLVAVLGSAVGAAVLLAVLFLRPEIRQRGRDWLARWPILGRWLLEAEIGRWSSMLSTLLENRVGLLRALELTEQTIQLTALRASLSQVTKVVRQGVSLSQALQDSDALNATGYNLIRVGERSGQLPGMLHSLSQLYVDSGRQRMKRFLLLLEPIAILLIGGVIGLIMTGIILAITSVNDISI